MEETEIKIVRCGRCAVKLYEISDPDNQFISLGSAEIYMHVRIICGNCGRLREWKPKNLGWTDSDLSPAQQRVSREIRSLRGYVRKQDLSEDADEFI